MKSNILKIALFFLIGCLTGCNDDELLYERGEYMPTSRSLEANNTGGLVKQPDGTWKATRRVPLVGMGRVVNNVSSSVVAVGALDTSPDALTDLDLTNTYNPQSAIVGADVALNQIASVKDLNHVYSGGQKVGFLCKSLESSVLELTVLKGFWIDTYRNGEKVESFSFTNSTSVLDLGLGNIAGGNTDNTFVIEHEFHQPFDEVRIGMSGVEADVVKQMGIYYAYVGENPMMPAVNGGVYSDYFGNNVDYVYETAYTSVSLKKLIDSDLDNGIEIGTLSNLFQPRMTIDFGREIPAGSEVGWYVTSGSVLDLGLGASIKVTTFDESGNELDSYSYTKIVGLGLLGGGKTIFSLTTKSPCRRIKLGFYGVTVNLGAKVVHYAFVREKTELDASSYLSPADATVYNPNYKFATILAGSVKYSLIGKPDGSSATVTSNGIYGMNVAGKYQIQATYTAPDGTVITQDFTVTRAINDQALCNDAALVNKNQSNIYRAYAPDGSGGLIIGGGSQDSYTSVVDEDLGNKATLNEKLEIAIGGTGVIGVKRNDGASINSDKKNVRVGFVVDNNSTFLKADVLKLFQIRLKKGTEIIDKDLAKGAISVGLIKGNNQGQTLTRLSINTNKEFDAVELYAIKPVTINIATGFGIYYAFCEDEMMECSNPGIDCMQLITNANSGATVSLKNMGLASVAAVCTNLGSIVDDDFNSYGTIVKTVDAGTATEISVQFNTIKASEESPQQVGFILKNNDNLVSLIGVTQIQAYYKGEKVEEKTSYGVLDVELTNDKSFFPLTVNKDFDELRIVIGSGVNIGKGLNVCGVYLKPDLDGDGVLDCVGDDVQSGLKGFSVSNDNICIGDIPEFNVLGAQSGYPYYLEFYKEESDDKPVLSIKTAVVDGVINGSDKTEIDKLNNYLSDESNAGIYTVRFSPTMGGTDQALVLIVHPQQTTWIGQNSNDWEDWDNWDNGTPWSCTDVVLPSPSKLSSKRYPVLNQKNTYYCQNIHFETGAVLIGQNRLSYSGKVYVDMELKGDDYHLLSAPLQGMVTGDMFVTQSEWNLDGALQNNKWNTYDNYFTDLTPDNYKEQRTSPVVYQRFWSKMVQNKALSRASALMTEPYSTDWSRTFNAVSTPYVLGQGFAVKVGKGGNTDTYKFHFPKSHSEYNYYSTDGTWRKSESFTRSRYNGKFMADYGNFLSTVTLKRMSSGDKFLMGNPFMAYIDVEKFIAANQDAVTGIHLYGGNGGYQTIQSGTIAPMQAVFLSVANSSESMQVKFTEDMLTIDEKSETPVTPVSCLRITASKSGHTSQCSVGISASYKDGYDAHEDITTIIGGEVKPEVAVFSIVEDKALSVQRTQSPTQIPLGFYIKSPGRVTLSFSNKDAKWDGWQLVDKQSGKHYSLKGNIVLENVASCDNRFYLEKRK